MASSLPETGRITRKADLGVDLASKIRSGVAVVPKVDLLSPCVAKYHLGGVYGVCDAVGCGVLLVHGVFFLPGSLPPTLRT